MSGPCSWGITDAQAKANKIILICLDGIADCDLFLGFYGSRCDCCDALEAVYGLTCY